MRSPRLTSLRLALIVGVVLSAVRLVGCSGLDWIDTRTVDYRLVRRGPAQASPEVAIVAIDDQSIERYGRWPWDRALLARLLRTVSAERPAVVGLDLVLSEASSCGAVAAGAADQALVDAVRASGHAVLGYFFDLERPEADAQPAEVSAYDAVRQDAQRAGMRRVPQAAHAVSNLPELARAARGTGYFNVFPDAADGIYRRVPMAIRYGERLALPLSLALLRQYWNEDPVAIRLAGFGVDSVRIGGRRIPVAEDGQLLLNYRGPRGQFTRVSAADLLDEHRVRDAASRLRGKIVLIGVTATAVTDVRPTPFDGVFPGVEMHATAIDNILRQDFLRQPLWTVVVEVAVVMLIALLLGTGFRFVRGVGGLLLVVAVGAGYWFASQAIFERGGLTLSLAYPIVTIALVYAVIALRQYLEEQSAKRRVRDAFGMYLNRRVVDLVSNRPDMLTLSGENRVLTLLFCDVRGFTKIAEGLAPEKLVELLNRYLGEMTDVVFSTEGTLDKYIGDALMAFWGAPIEQPDHAARACRAALAMRARLAELRPLWHERGFPPVEAGIGIHSGEVIIGNLGSSRRLSYTAVGDSVNVASRLEGLTRLYNVPIVVSEETMRAAGDGWIARELDLVLVKGRSQPVRVFELRDGVGGEVESVPAAAGPSAAGDAFLLGEFAAALSDYRAGHWRQALARFEELLERFPGDGPSRLFAGRCRELLSQDPGADWGPVTILETK